MKPADIASLLAPFLGSEKLAGQQLDQVSGYLDLLLKWNARVNLTAVRSPEEIIPRHFGESFFAARHLLPSPVVIPSGVRPAAAGSAQSRDVGVRDLIDLGSGAGFPGLPMKIYAPALSLTLIESNQKKATFLREVARAIAFTDIDVFAGRAEDFPGCARIVTLRAVEKPQRALAGAVHLLAPGGRLALLLGALRAVALPGLLSGFSWSDPAPIPASSARVLLVGTRNRQESKW